MLGLWVIEFSSPKKLKLARSDYLSSYFGGDSSGFTEVVLSKAKVDAWPVKCKVGRQVGSKNKRGFRISQARVLFGHLSCCCFYYSLP